MSSYRFCRTDDIGLLVDALNRCWAPYFPDEPPMTAAAFKRTIRDLQVWCSSCMVAFAGPDPIAVLIGAKRPSGTLIHRIAVHPDHRGQGHGRHLLDSLGSKLAILGPRRIVAEVPDTLAPARALFAGVGYVEEAVLTDYVMDGPVPSERADCTRVEEWIIPVTVDDLAANGLLERGDAPVCWERSAETLMARKDELAGFAVASEERLEACILYIKDAAEVAFLRCMFDDGGARLRRLVGRTAAAGTRTLRLPKVHPAEIAPELLETAGFRPAGTHRVYAAA